MTEFFNEPTTEQLPHLSLNHEYLPHHFVHVLVSPTAKFNPLIIFIGDSQEQLHIIPLSHLSSHGFTIALLSADQLNGDLHQQVSEIKSAIRFLLLHAAQFSIDTNRIFIWGEGRGADLSGITILTANDPEWNAEDPRVLPLRLRAGFLFGASGYDKLTAMIPAHKRPALFVYNGECDSFDESSRNQFIHTYQLQNEAQDFILKNTTSGTSAFYTPYMLTIIENQLRKYL